MNIIKRISVVFSLTILSILLIACGDLEEPNVENNSTSDDSKESVTLKLGHVFAEDDITHKSSVKLAELANEYSGGEISVDVFSNSQLGEERDLVEGVKLGTV